MMNVGILSKHTNIVDLKISFGLNLYVNFSTAFFRKKCSFCVAALVLKQASSRVPSQFTQENCLNETCACAMLCMFIIHNLNATMHLPVLLSKERSVWP